MRRLRIRGRHARAIAAAWLLAAAALPIGALAVPEPAFAAVPCAPLDIICAAITVDGSGTGSGTITDRNEPHQIACTITAGVESGDCSGYYGTDASPQIHVDFDIVPAAGSIHCVNGLCDDEGEPTTAGYGLPDQSEVIIKDQFELATRTVTAAAAGTGAGYLSL